ncbi:MAG: helix-turn-helix transcriptional regulator, partial [Planctomycetota bacterium]
MSTVDYNLNLEGMHTPGPVVSSIGEPQPLHRIREVRQQQGVSLRSAARKLGLPMQEVRHQENPHQDLLLTQLASWQAALDVPLADLL